MKFNRLTSAALRFISDETLRKYSQLKLVIGNESAPGALVSETENLFQVGASTARQAATVDDSVAFTNFPAAFWTSPYERLAVSAYWSSTKPIEPDSFLTLSTMSALRSADSPTGHLGEGVRPISLRNSVLVLDRKSVNT